MANGITLSASLSYTGNNATVAPPPLVNQAISVSGNGLNALNSVTVPTTAAAIPLGNVTAPGGIIWVKNNDPTNFIQLLTGTGGIAFARILPGEAYPLRLDAGLTAPFWKANTATVQATLAIFDA